MFLSYVKGAAAGGGGGGGGAEQRKAQEEAVQRSVSMGTRRYWYLVWM